MPNLNHPSHHDDSKDSARGVTVLQLEKLERGRIPDVYIVASLLPVLGSIASSSGLF